jgi:hypothetical protein
MPSKGPRNHCRLGDSRYMHVYTELYDIGSVHRAGRASLGREFKRWTKSTVRSTMVAMVSGEGLRGTRYGSRSQFSSSKLFATICSKMTFSESELPVDVTLSREQKTEKTKGLLRWAALFLGELRDGLTMVRFCCYLM